MIRKTLAVVLGIVAGSAFNMAMVAVSHAVFPLPEGIEPERIDPIDFEAIKGYVETHGMPTGALVIVPAALLGLRMAAS